MALFDCPWPELNSQVLYFSTGLERLTTPPDYDIQAARYLLGRRINGYLIVLVILLLVVWEMVFKPGL